MSLPTEISESGSKLTYHAAALPTRHSGIGLASTVVSVLAAIFLLSVAGAGVYAELNLPGGIDGVDEDSLPFNLAMCLLFLGYGLACTGVGLGIGGIIQPDRKQIFAWVGLSFNGCIVLTLIALLAIGVVVA